MSFSDQETQTKAFYFWETLPGRNRPAYLDLCVETWRKNAPSLEIIHVNHDNLEYWTNGCLTVDAIKHFSLPLQSDAIAAAVLFHHPGFFLDIDTVILPGFTPKTFNFTNALAVYGTPDMRVNTSLGFFYAEKPENPFINKWLNEILTRVKKQNTGFQHLKNQIRWHLKKKPIKVKWNYLGNDIFDPLSQDSSYAKSLVIRDYKKLGFAIHELHDSPYEAFWFNDNHELETVLNSAQDNIFCLQNSWTPSDYMNLSAEEVLRHPCLLSKVFNYSLQNPA